MFFCNLVFYQKELMDKKTKRQKVKDDDQDSEDIQKTSNDLVFIDVDFNVGGGGRGL